MLPPRAAGCPSELALEAHLAAADAKVAEHAAGCPHCRGWLAAAVRIGARFEAEVAPSQLRTIRARLETEAELQPRGWRRLLAALQPVGLAAAAAGLVLASAAVLRMVDDPTPAITAKGAGLQVHVQSRAGVRAAIPGEPVEAGDALRFTVAPAGPRHVFVLSIDGEGSVSRLAPAGGEDGLWIEGPTTLPGSAVLDDAGGPERIFAVFSREPLPWREVEAAARRAAAERPGPDGLRGLGALPLRGAEQSTLLLERR